MMMEAVLEFCKRSFDCFVFQLRRKCGFDLFCFCRIYPAFLIYLLIFGFFWKVLSFPTCIAWHVAL